METPEQKRQFIDKLGKKLLDYQKQGYLIIDNRDRIAITIEQTGFNNEFGLCIDDIVFYSHDPNIDNGYHNSMETLLAMANSFKIVKPQDIIRLEM